MLAKKKKFKTNKYNKQIVLALVQRLHLVITNN